MKRLIRFALIGIAILFGLCALLVVAVAIFGPKTPPTSTTTTAAPQPTLLVEVSTPAPVAATAAPAAPALLSGGLGLTRAEWEAQHAKDPSKPAPLGERYDSGYVVAYQADTAGVDTVWYIDQQWTDAGVQTMDAARAAVKAIIPADSVLVKTYEANGHPVDLFMSAWLKERFPTSVKVKNIDLSMWPNGEPGNFSVSYIPSKDKVASIILGLGDNP